MVSASGKIQPKRFVNISADTMGRVTELAVNEGDRIKKGQFLLQIDPRNLRSAVQRTRGVARGGALDGPPAPARDRERQDGGEAGGGHLSRQQQLWKGGLTTRETLDNAENDLKMRQADLRTQEQQIMTQRRGCSRKRPPSRPRATT